MEKIMEFLKANQNDLVLVIGIVLVSLISFGVGRLTADQSVSPEPIIIERAVLFERVLPSNGMVNKQSIDSGNFVASISGTKYHLPKCSGAKRIKEENKVWFKTKEEAEKAGYGPAANCPGL